MTTPLHPLIVHFPMALAALMPLIAAGALFVWWRGYLPKAVWAAVVLFQLTLVVSSFAAMQTGESDEERVERVVAETHIEVHEEAAEVFLWAGVSLLVLGLLPFLLKDPRQARIAGLFTVAGTLVVLGLGYRVGVAGGNLVYTHGAASAFTAPPGNIGPGDHGRERHDDD